ncbi:MAG: polyprenyl synthetase family protein, partial [Gemmatimonadales bacterium]
MRSDRSGYGAPLVFPGPEGETAGVTSAAALLVETVAALALRAPSITASAGRELGSTVLALHFGDGSHATIRTEHHALVATPERTAGSVECFFDDDSLLSLYDLERRPREILEEGAFDLRGAAAEVLAAWRTFHLLAQRGAGLRYVQGLWLAYRRNRGLPFGANGNGAGREPSPPSDAPDAAALLRDGAAGNGSASVARTRVLWDRRSGQGWWTFEGPRDADLFDIMESYRRRVAEEIERLIPRRQPVASLYRLMHEYPSRGGKGLRPTLCIATCGAFGGQSGEAVRVAAAVEMFHNAFLIHDDIEDESLQRRGRGCLHQEHGIPLAVNTGDGLNLLAVATVLSNIEELGLSRTLGLIHETIHMCRESIEGQAIELGWIRQGAIPTRDSDYVNMVCKKTGWYTCRSPCRLGAIAAGHTRPHELDLIGEVFKHVGIAFQIQDDVLNLVGKEDLYGKEPLGDLLEGKRTLMLIHLMRSVSPRKRAALLAWLVHPRSKRTFEESEEVLRQMELWGSIDHARRVAARHAARAATLFEETLGFLPESEDKAILRQV